MAGIPVSKSTTTTAPAGAVDIRPLLRGFSIELSSSEQAVERAASHVDRGSDVYVNWIPGNNHHRTVAAAARLGKAGFNPVPHIAARYLTGPTQLADFLARLAGEAGVRQALIIGGDRERPDGAFDSSLQLLETGLFQKYGIRRIGMAGYPEGNPRISATALAAALTAKLDYAEREGLLPYVITQFCFEAAPILDWLRSFRERRPNVPVRIGLAGPAGLATLMKFALRCGVGNSIRALSLRGPAIARLLTEAGPDRVIRDLAQAHNAGQAPGLAGLHFFPFGGFTRTADWARSVLASDPSAS
jgi:methylenetetrahydrofolate reductase (NADPH)